MDARLTSEQQWLREAAEKLSADLGPGSVLDLDGEARLARLEKAVADTGWRRLRSDGASGVEVALVAEEFGRGLIDVPYLGPVLADELLPAAVEDRTAWTLAVHGEAVDARGMRRAVELRDTIPFAGTLGDAVRTADLTRSHSELVGAPEPLPALTEERAARFHALALVATSADLLGAARGAHALACEYAKIREQYGQAVGSYQAVSHPLAEGLALIEGSTSVLRYAAWTVDATGPEEALRSARVAKVYCARAARTVCETAIQVHGGIGNTWECLAHVYLRRVLTSSELFPVRLEEIDLGLS
ncbi:acyl-CoA dehydrogenase family protein [Streptomyces sp. LUP47B]|uniref:acyl-CoA dehydrogenase family protein n=1 Tax=Streptomyces sp. LUP47B TaxID=1890286 RepID=UPI0008520770|nr:acyl-CoA dehydrogenase family protein [Streptomyces sp. LUP47B]